MGFRQDMRAFIEAECPASCRDAQGEAPGGGTKAPMTADQRLWLDRCAERGLTVPTWPKEYGGTELSQSDFLIFLDEMNRAGAHAPVTGMGTMMIGPTLLEFGTDEQKAEHLPKIANGDVWWCQGYSEPGSGSDLASLRTKAEDAGDHFVINGQKIWTTGAQFADWIFCLVRTDFDAPKHDGISFVLFDMNQPGVQVKPIQLISGNSPFCETFFADAIADKKNLVSRLNKGWTVAKRLLQHERSGMRALASGGNRETGEELDTLAKRYLGETDGRITDASIRAEIAGHQIDAAAFRLTQKRTVQESEAGDTPGPATSIFKLYGARLARARTELQVSVMGTRGVGWDGNTFDENEIDTTRSWLRTKARSIAGGTDEVQQNIIAKRVLGLPD